VQFKKVLALSLSLLQSDVGYHVFSFLVITFNANPTRKSGLVALGRNIGVRAQTRVIHRDAIIFIFITIVVIINCELALSPCDAP